MTPTPPPAHPQTRDGQVNSSPAQQRTAAVMRSTAEQLRVAARMLLSRAAASRDDQVAIRLRVLSTAVSAQAEDIERRAARLTGDHRGL
jgi:hypothetical protein